MPQYLMVDSCGVYPSNPTGGTVATAEVTVENPSFNDVIYDLNFQLVDPDGDVVINEMVAEDENLGHGYQRDYSHDFQLPHPPGEYNVHFVFADENQVDF